MTVAFGVPSVIRSRSRRSGLVVLIALLLIAAMPSQFSAHSYGIYHMVTRPSFEYVSGALLLTGIVVSGNSSGEDGYPWLNYQVNRTPLDNLSAQL
jgi:hypothetical protein